MYKNIKNLLLLLFFFVGFIFVKSQKDSIFISVGLLQNNDLGIKQKIIYYNRFSKPLSKLKLLNWVSAYKNKGTALAKRKLEEGNSQMYFSKPEQLGGLYNLTASIGGEAIFDNIDTQQENIYLFLPKLLKSGDKVEINLEYRIKLPNYSFTFYGKDKKNNFYLKYFFIVPDGFETETQKAKFFLDLEENQNLSSFWSVDFQDFQDYKIQSNLKKRGSENLFQGMINSDIEFYLSKYEHKVFSININNEKIAVELAFPVEENDLDKLEFYLPLHLRFISEKLGYLPKKILISPKQKKLMSFLGNKDINILAYKLPLFSDSEKIDLDYFSLISYNVLQSIFASDKDKDHWLKNGLKTYLEIQYLKKNYASHPLLGSAKDWSILGLKPFRWTNASKFHLIDRYGIAYQYVVAQNLDQAIGTDFKNLKDYNHTLSHFEMGLLLNFVSEKEGNTKFENFIKKYIHNNKNTNINYYDFLNSIVSTFGEEYIVIKDFIKTPQRVDFAIKSVQQLDENQYKIKVSKNILQNIPFKLKLEGKEGNTKEVWLETKKEKLENTYQFYFKDLKKLSINPNYSFLESNFRNNFFQKNGLGLNKKLKIRFFTDIPNPEFNEIYINPEFSYNIYDEFLVGINFSNQALVSLPFSYSITPYISMGTHRPTGIAAVAYQFQPVNSFFRRLVIGASGSYFHYNYGLSYRNMYFYSIMNFKNTARSFVNKSFRISYQYIDRDTFQQNVPSNFYSHYGLWNFGFNLGYNHPIHESFFTTKLQLMRDFQKLSFEGIYYWKFHQKKDARFRFYGGIFSKNNAKNRTFDFGISRVNDYNFSYSLLGQSALSGLFFQEFILAEGGFKSYVGSRANQWVFAFNTDIQVWKMFYIYGDAGIYKNKNFLPKTIWDSGIKISFIPNILEFYFPLFSSLGFEPTLQKYDKRIRFSLNLDVNSLSRTIRKIFK